MIAMSSIKDAIEDLFNNPELTTEDAVARHFTPSFRQRINGNWIDHASFLAIMVSMREIVDHVTVTVLDECFAEHSYAQRHVIDLLKHDGERIVQEVYLFAKRGEDGRFDRIEETTLLIES